MMKNKTISLGTLSTEPSLSKYHKWYWLMPGLALTLFVLIMGSILWWLDFRDDNNRAYEFEKEVDSVRENMHSHLVQSKESLFNLAQDLIVKKPNSSHLTFSTDATTLMENYPEIINIIWLDSQGMVLSSVESQQYPFALFFPGQVIFDQETSDAFKTSLAQKKFQYSPPYVPAGMQSHIFELHIPIFDNKRLKGGIVAVYSLENLLEYYVPTDFRKRYTASFENAQHQILAQTDNQTGQKKPTLRHTTGLPLLNQQVILAASAYRTPTEATQTMLIWIVVSLSCAVIWSLVFLWRHTRLRSHAEEALFAEAMFRRAMEDSLITGMRVLDLDGRITYVNPAFCRIVGWDEKDLLGKMPPYPYWSDQGSKEHHEMIQALLTGNAPSTGMEMQAQRRDGSRFIARLYVSKLVNQKGEQTGWITSMTDITEPTRIRQALRASHERFTMVLESLQDAISVTADADLLFTNYTYRDFFGSDITGHNELVTVPSGISPQDTVEVYSPSVDKWFEVRHRILQWVDGRKARLQVARDITEQRAAEQASLAQQEKIQLTSRLIAMGEMASSLAHELNQPLTAIANYSNAAMSILSQEHPDASILPILEKTSQQALRAGMIIRRIREFVKRSEPKKQAIDLRPYIESAIALAEIEAYKKSIPIVVDIPENLPIIEADPILIEQVLFNLLKNAIEAMDNGTQGSVRLSIELYTDYVRCMVTDAGHGLQGKDTSQLFEPFFSTKPEGMGMGLNICRTIIEFHHGRLWAEDHPEGGCTFFFTLPLTLNASQTDMVEE